ncbi:hypothetical protein ACFLZ5_06915, partial [Thermodesulfobacteriota bacterium]
MIKKSTCRIIFFLICLLPCLSSGAEDKCIKGDCLNGKGVMEYHGQGKITFPTGEYVGEFKNGMRNGKGKLVLADGEVYEGNWKNDRKHGAGVLKTATGKKYEGNWFEGKYIE